VNHVTDDEAEQFRKHLRTWQTRLGLGTWRIVFSPKPAKNAMARVAEFDWPQRQARIELGRDWKSSPVNAGTLEQTAVHELLHVVLYELVEAARNPHASADELVSIEHAVVNALEKALVPGDFE
jgi:hypothetical protein